jgi:hypothetical protein
VWGVLHLGQLNFMGTGRRRVEAPRRAPGGAPAKRSL